MLGEVAADVLRDRVLVLRRLPQLAELEHEVLVQLAEQAHLIHPRRGAVLLEEGKPLDRVFCVIEGSARVTQGDHSYVAAAPRTVGFRELSAGLSEAPRVELLEDSLVIELPAETLLTMLYELPSLARSMVRLSARALLRLRGNLPLRPDEATPPEMGVRRVRELTLVERIIALRRSPLWQHANLDAVAELSKHIVERHVEAGTVLFEIGDAAHHSFRLEYGIVRCENESGESVRVGAGFLIGSLDGIAAQPRSYRAVAETQAILFELSTATQLAVIEVHPELAARLRVELTRVGLMTERALGKAP